MRAALCGVWCHLCGENINPLLQLLSLDGAGAGDLCRAAMALCQGLDLAAGGAWWQVN